MSDASFLKVRTGLQCIFWGVIGYIVPSIVGTFLREEPAATMVIRCLELGSLLLVFVGQMFCLNVPAEMPGSGYIYAALTCDTLTIVATASLFFWDPMVLFNNPQAVLALLILLVVLFFLGDILFNVFLKKLAQYIDDRQSASKASGLLILKIIVWSMSVLSVVIPFAAILVAKGNAIVFAGMAAAALMIIAGILCILVLFQYLSLLSALQNSLLRAAKPSFSQRAADVVDQEDVDEMFKDFEG